MKQSKIWCVPVQTSTGTAETKFFRSRQDYDNFEKSNQSKILGDVQEIGIGDNGELTGVNYEPSSQHDQSNLTHAE